MKALVHHQAPCGGGRSQHRYEGVLGRADCIWVLVIAGLGYHEFHLVAEDVPQRGNDTGELHAMAETGQQLDGGGPNFPSVTKRVMMSLTACPVRTKLEPSMVHTSCNVSSVSPLVDMTEDSNLPADCITVELLVPMERVLLRSSILTRSDLVSCQN